jgi:hypothetical protein
MLWCTALVASAHGVCAQDRQPAQAAQTASPIDYATARLDRVVGAVRITDRIVLDGRLDEPAWARATPATNFIQWEPLPGQPASEQTDVRFLYDADTLYVGARCWDSDARSLTVHELQQDFESREEDVLAVFIDSLHDRQSGFSFWTNPAGARRDVQIFQDDAQRSVDWDGVWSVRVATDDRGWTAEFAIPFKTLRFTSASHQDWGLNMLRRVKRKNEDSYWSPLPRRYRTMRPSMSGTITGLEGIRQGRNLKIKPFAIASTSQLSSTGLSRRTDADGGVDLKYGLTPSLTLDGTYRTDFSQVEVDQQQVNLTRFNLFFPEKREFFLENSGVFGIGGASGPGGEGGRANVVPFFSRRIGLSSSGTPIPIVAGARMSGSSGSYDIGLLTMKTEESGATPSNNFLVGRLRRNIRGGSSVGAIFTSRDAPGAAGFNRLYGVDTLLRFFDRKLDVASYLLSTDTPGRSGDTQARLFQAAWRDDSFSLVGLYETVQPNFNPEVGFVRRRDMSHYSGDASWQPRPANTAMIRNFDLSIGADLYENNTGRVETREHSLAAGVAFQNSATLSFNLTDTFESLTAPFAIQPSVVIPAGDYRYRRYGVDYKSNRGRALSGSVSGSTGEFWDGRSWAATAGVEVRPNYHVDISLDVSRNTVSLPAGDFTATLLGLRALYAFTSNAFFNSYLQYNATTNQLTANTRFNIIHRPLSDLFLVYNEQRDTVAGHLLGRTLTLKVTNLFDF